ncbi:MAG: hypothetical protein COZ59_04715, partial [Bacteroidetes bacterium CG_4_8_14_3_um_filter_31_14]
NLKISYQYMAPFYLRASGEQFYQDKKARGFLLAWGRKWQSRYKDRAGKCVWRFAQQGDLLFAGFLNSVLFSER